MHCSSSNRESLTPVDVLIGGQDGRDARKGIR
jgi:hypothetical protein